MVWMWWFQFDCQTILSAIIVYLVCIHVCVYLFNVYFSVQMVHTHVSVSSLAFLSLNTLPAYTLDLPDVFSPPPPFDACLFWLWTALFFVPVKYPANKLLTRQG